MSESDIFHILCTGLWLLAPRSWLRLPIQCFRMVANRCLKMRAPVNVKDGGDGGRLVVVCNM